MPENRTPDEERMPDPSADVEAVDEKIDETDEVGLPDHDFLGMNPRDANDETDPGAPPVPHGG